MYARTQKKNYLMNNSPFIETVRTELKTRRYSIQTEKSYIYLIRYFILINSIKSNTLTICLTPR